MTDKMSDERESQLSAMFDGELPEHECELLARRLTRDEELRAKWARYAVVGAVLRKEPLRTRRGANGGIQSGVAQRVRSAVSAEAMPTHGGTAAGHAPAVTGRLRWAKPVAGLGIAAGVAALSVLWLQQRVADQVTASGSVAAVASELGSGVTLVVVGGAPATVASASLVAASRTRALDSNEPVSYTTPRSGNNAGLWSTSLGDAQLANYVFAHSEVSAPLARRNLLSTLVSGSVAPAVAANAGH